MLERTEIVEIQQELEARIQKGPVDIGILPLLRRVSDLLTRVLQGEEVNCD